MPASTTRARSDEGYCGEAATEWSDDDIHAILEQDGVSHLLVLIRDRSVDRQKLIEQITLNQEKLSARTKRFLLAFIDTLIPG